MSAWKLEIGFAHQYLTRWTEHYSFEFKDMSAHDANFLLSSKLRNSKLGDELIPTATEIAAADVLSIVCSIEHAITTDKASMLFDEVPIIKVLANSLAESINVLEKLTGNDCITKSNMAKAESINLRLSNALSDMNNGIENLPIAKTNNVVNTTGWKDEARRIADELFDKDTKLNCRRTLEAYAKQVMNEMQELEIHGARGRITNHRTIMRDALQGDKWWKKKIK